MRFSNRPRDAMDAKIIHLAAARGEAVSDFDRARGAMLRALWTLLTEHPSRDDVEGEVSATMSAISQLAILAGGRQ